MNITIQRATTLDAEAILEYLKQVGKETDNLTFGEEGMPFTIEAEAAYIAEIEYSNDDIMLVAKDDESIVGIANLNRLPRRMNHRGDFGLSVRKAYWDKGIGSTLLQEIVDFAKEAGMEIIDLQVRSDNARAIHVYEKFGFYKIGSHPKYHKVGDEYHACDYMVLELKQAFPPIPYSLFLNYQLKYHKRQDYLKRKIFHT